MEFDGLSWLDCQREDRPSGPDLALGTNETYGHGRRELVLHVGLQPGMEATPLGGETRVGKLETEIENGYLIVGLSRQSGREERKAE